MEALGIGSRGKPRVLEIGFISGGESIIAFEQLGFEAHGLDYSYGGQFEAVQRWQVVRGLTATRVEFHRGDITRQTEFEEGFFDLICSRQTLEHIAEMHRLLRPGGAMFHVYDPYHGPMGGHSFGTLDSPWGHSRLADKEVEAYLRTHRNGGRVTQADAGTRRGDSDSVGESRELPASAASNSA